MEQALVCFPSRAERMKFIELRNRNAISKVDGLSLAEKRNCFLSLRAHCGEILTSSVFFPLNVTVGQLAFAQVLSSHNSRS